MPSENEGDGEKTVPLENYTTIFEKQFPYYLAIGMTAEQYWDGPAELVTAYRKAEEIRNERRNTEFWLQGVYVYDAICKASPILHAFAKKGAKPAPYPTEPYSISEKQEKKKEEKKEKAVYEKGKKLMESFLQSTNKKFKKE